MSSADVIRVHYDASSRGDLDGMLAPLSADASWIEAAGSPYAGTYVGPAAVAAQVFARIGSEWDGYRFDLEELVDGGDTVVGIGTYTGVFRATGREMSARVAHVWHVRDGRVVRFEQVADSVPLVAATNVAARASAATTDTEPGWKAYDDFALGIDTNRLPAENLQGTALRVRTDAGLTLDCDFISDNEVQWRAGGVEAWEGAEGTDPYDAVAVGDHALFVDLPLGSRSREALTLISSRRTRRALVVVSTIAPEPAPGEPQVGQQFLAGQVGDDPPEPGSPTPAPTRDLIGERLLHRYSPNHLYEHIYLSSERYVWQCLEGVQRGHGDVDLATHYKFDDDLYIFAFREFRIPVASVFFYDMKEMTSTGRFLGLTGDGVSMHSRSGARIIPLGTVTYPDVKPV